MMNRKNFGLTWVFLLLTVFVVAQNRVQMTRTYGSSSKDLQHLLYFENIYFEALHFKGALLKGKSYKIFIREYTAGKLKGSVLLFDGTESDFFKIKSDSLSVKFACKMEERHLKLQIFGNGFSSRKTFLPLIKKADDYALKDFFGEKSTLNIDVDKPSAVLAIITPHYS